jgi:pimeloyl-ACP methyl ester carboxylesterase
VYPAVRAADDCAALATLEFAATEITVAQSVPAEPAMDLPPYCRVHGVANRRVGAGGVPYGIGFELRLPDGWNRRFLFQGGAGTDGAIFNPIGYAQGVGGASRDTGSGLSRRFAVVATDGGHEGFGQEFGLDPQARVDFGYAALDVVARIAKDIATRYYRRPIKRSYLVGCSNGGRQAMIASQRLPGHFDGLVAASPAFHLSGVVIAETWDTIAFASIAPPDGAGGTVLAGALSDADLTLLAGAVLAACDANDGLADGLVEAPSQCRFDPAALACPGAKDATCLGAGQVAAIARVFGGPRDSSGRALYADWPWDAGIGDATWKVWKLGSSATAAWNAINVTLGFPMLRYVLLTPPDPAFDPLAFDFDADPARLLHAAAIVDATSTDLEAFRRRRGKLLMYAGLSDPVFSARDLVGYYERLADAQGGLARTRRFARLFLVPGMTHCLGGPSLDSFDPLTAIVRWVEKGRAPRHLVATGAAFPGRSRPLCPYPEEARHRGRGSIEGAESFRCVAP